MSDEAREMADHDDPAIAPPSSATVAMIIAVSIVILIASGYMVYTYSSVSPSTPAAEASSTTGR